MSGIISASRFKELKAAVKAECLRRSYTGSVADYGGSSYDYTTEPVDGGMIKIEYYEKNAVPLNAISGDIGSINLNQIITEAGIKEMEEKVAALAAIDKTSSSTGCKASCTGLCSSSCSGGCSGCGGACSSSCSGSCSGGCSTTCSGKCDTTCTDACKGDCGTQCEASCGSGCGGTCHTNCDTYCKGTCGNGCGTTCTSNCSYWCQGNAQKS